MMMMIMVKASFGDRSVDFTREIDFFFGSLYYFCWTAKRKKP